MLSSSNPSRRVWFVAPVVAALLALSGQALAADRGRDRGWDHCSDYGRGHRGFGDHTSRGLSFGFGLSNYGSGLSLSVGNRFGYGHGDYCEPVRPYCEPVRPYCPPVRSYCPPPVYVRPYCPPVIYSRYDDCPPRREIIVSSPVYVDRPVYVEREVVVQTPAPQPVIVERPVYVQQPAPTQTVYSAQVRPPAPVAEQATYRDRELGDAYLRMGDPDNAVRVYSKYLTAWNSDGVATRNLGFAQIARGDAQDGARAVIRGYQLEPTMLQRPLAPGDLGGIGPFQRTLDNAARAASGSNSSEAWLTVAILQHAAGQRDQAVNALQKSRDAGLDKALLDQFTLELGK